MKSILAILISLLSLNALAQSAAPKQGTAKAGAQKQVASGNCFKEWYTLFKERGANPVPDGTQDVVITIRNNDYSECFMGKIDVAGGKLGSKIQIQKMDGSYEEFDKSVSAAYQNEGGTLKDELREISNGMSASVTLSDGETIRLFFYKYLADIPKANKKAPSPATLIKN